MKKHRFVYLLMLIAAVGVIAAFALWHMGTEYRIAKNEALCRNIYLALMDRPFSSGKLERDVIILYDSEFNELEKLPLEDKLKGTSLRIVKENEQCRFILGGSVDDEYGILFSTESSVNMDGLHRLERLSGNAYYYVTR